MRKLEGFPKIEHIEHIEHLPCVKHFLIEHGPRGLNILIISLF